MVPSMLATYVGKTAAQTTLNSRANCGCHGGQGCTWESWVVQTSFWKQKPEDEKCQETVMTDDGGIGSCLLLSLYPSIVDAFGITVVRTELVV